MDNKINFTFPSETKIRKSLNLKSPEGEKIIREYSDKQIWNNKPLMRVLKRLSET